MLIDERKAFLEELKAHVQQEVVAISRRFLADFADTDLEGRMMAAFINHLQKASVDVKSTISEFVSKAAGPIVVRSAFDLTEEGKTKFQEALRNAAEANLIVVFEHSDEVLCGIELISNGRKVSWTMAKYLSELQQDVEEFIERKNERNVPE
jgi:F-type H+-transporting ATPase subunit b